MIMNFSRLRRGEKSWKELGVLWMLLGWFLGVGLITLMPFAFGGENVRVISLVPFQELFTNGAGIGGSVLKEGIANVLLFVVGGVLFALARRTSVLRTMAFLTCFAIVIEVGQFILNIGRVSSIDDVIWAAIGSMIGAFVVRIAVSSKLVTSSAT